jgi:thiol-disulfide isomerase/thioredoxin
MGFTSMHCYYYNVFEKDGVTLIFDIAPDGTFEKKFQAYYPTCEVIAPDNSNIRFDNVPIFARPGETIDITIKPNEHGIYECYYNNGSCKEVERWLKADLDMWELTKPISEFKGNISEMDKVADQTWLDILYIIQREATRQHFTTQEMQLALASMQGSFIEAIANYIRSHKRGLVKVEEVDGDFNVEILDSIEWNELKKMENYKMMQRVDYDNPLLICNDFHFVLNRIQYADVAIRRQYEGVENENGEYIINAENYKKMLADYLSALRELMGTDKNNLTAQLCVYNNMTNFFDIWRSREDSIPQIQADATITPAEREQKLANLASLSNLMPVYLDVLTNPFIHQKAEEFYAKKMEQKEIAAPLPTNNPSADLIRSLCEKYPGRYLVIDFWGMHCGPCRAEIEYSKEQRAKIAQRDDVKLVFIAEERTSEGSDGYKKYVAEWLADEETVCLSKSDFNRMMELFRFNGTPHYETITPDGRRVRDDLRIDGYDNFDYELERLKEKLK